MMTKGIHTPKLARTIFLVNHSAQIYVCKEKEAWFICVRREIFFIDWLYASIVYNLSGACAKHGSLCSGSDSVSLRVCSLNREETYGILGVIGFLLECGSLDAFLVSNP